MNVPASTPGVTVLGAATCEDTAIIRDRLAACGIPYRYADVDQDPVARSRVRDLNHGHRVTPTVIFGSDESVASEPSLENLGVLLTAAGFSYTRPSAVEIHGPLTQSPIPLHAVVDDGGRPFGLVELRGRRSVALFLAHGADCLPCFGYARQLGAHNAQLDEAEATGVVVVSSTAGEAARWREHVAPGSVLVDDPGATWRQAIAGHLDVSGDAAMLLVLDRFLAPRAISVAPEAGGLIDPADAVDWLRFLELECPECSGEVEWPEAAFERAATD